MITDYDVGVGNAARIIFNRKFSKKEMSVSNHFEQQTNEWSFKLLKHFGSEILKLRIEYKDLYRGVDYKLDNLILSKCRKSLQEITFVNADSYTMIDIDEPFEKVLKVFFISSKFGKLIQIRRIDKQPRLELEKRLMMETHIPALKIFSITNTIAKKQPTNENNGKVNNYNISTFLKLSPQLETVCISSDYHRDETTVKSQHELLYNFDGIKMDHELLGIIKTKLPNLKNVNIDFRQHSLEIKMPKFHFEELNTLQICFYSSEILDSYPISTGKVEKLILSGNELNVSVFKFIEKHTNVNVLNIFGDWKQGMYAQQRPLVDFVTEIIRLAPQLPFLNELHFPYGSRFFQPGQMLTLLSLCKNLQKLVIEADVIDAERKGEVTRLLRSLIPIGNGWKTQFTDDKDDFRRFFFEITK